MIFGLIVSTLKIESEIFKVLFKVLFNKFPMLRVFLPLNFFSFLQDQLTADPSGLIAHALQKAVQFLNIKQDFGPQSISKQSIDSLIDLFIGSGLFYPK